MSEQYKVSAEMVAAFKVVLTKAHGCVPGTCDWVEDFSDAEFTTALADFLPGHERMVREQVAADDRARAHRACEMESMFGPNPVVAHYADNIRFVLTGKPGGCACGVCMARGGQ